MSKQWCVGRTLPHIVMEASEDEASFYGERVCECDSEEQAAAIVREHNAHDALVEACKKASDILHGRKGAYAFLLECADERAELDAALALAEPSDG